MIVYTLYELIADEYSSRLFIYFIIIFPIQEDIEAQMKADKIKLALEKLKEAKVKKVR